MDVKVLVGLNLRRMRLERRLSQDALATRSGIAPSFLSQLETGKRAATVTTLDILAKTLRLPIVGFFADIKETPKGLPRGRRTRKAQS